MPKKKNKNGTTTERIENQRTPKQANKNTYVLHSITKKPTKYLTKSRVAKVRLHTKEIRH